MNKKQRNRNREKTRKLTYTVNSNEVTELLPNLAALQNYSGKATVVRVTSGDNAGIFVRDTLDATFSDNGGIVIGQVDQKGFGHA